MEEKITFESVFHKYSEDMKLVLENSSLSTIQNSITTPLLFLKDKELSAIDEKLLEEMKIVLLKGGYQKHTITNYFKVISPVFNYARKKERKVFSALFFLIFYLIFYPLHDPKCLLPIR